MDEDLNDDVHKRSRTSDQIDQNAIEASQVVVDLTSRPSAGADEFGTRVPAGTAPQSWSPVFNGRDGPRILNREEKNEALSILRQAIMLVPTGHAESIQPSTLIDYKNKMTLLMNRLDSQEELTNIEGWRWVLSAYIEAPESFKAYRAATCWHLRTAIRRLLTALCDLQRDSGLTPFFLNRCRYLQTICDEYREVKAWTKEDLNGGQAVEGRPTKSKLKDLKKISGKYPDWASRMQNALQYSMYSDAIRVLELIGCRSIELLEGVEISLEDPGWFSLKVLHGGKVTETSGQPWRKISLPVSKLPIHWLQALRKSGTFVVSIDDRDEFRNALQKASRAALPELPYATVYVYRHAFATRMRYAGFSAEEIGASMGHSAAETQSCYGIRFRGKLRDRRDLSTVARVSVPRPVRPLNKSFLDSVVAKKSKGKLSKP